MKRLRRIISLILTALIFAALSVGCDGGDDPGKGKTRAPFDNFSVHYLDVGEGDCALIHFSDGKNMLIDCGEKSEDYSEFIIKFLKDGGVSKIDYFLLTHPDSDHVGNAVDIINTFEIGTVYLSDIAEDLLYIFPVYKSALELIKEKDIAVNTSDCYDVIVGEDYCVAFLSPTPKSFTDSSYMDFNATTTPTATQSNALSPVIYLESQGVRFLFTGDAPIAQENFALQCLKINRTYYTGKGINVNLESVDFLKVSHHGSEFGSGEDFLNTVKPVNAVISVSGNNFYGHPSDVTLKRLITVNPEITLYRTDVHGTVSVDVNDCTYNIITDKDVA